MFCLHIVLTVLWISTCVIKGDEKPNGTYIPGSKEKCAAAVSAFPPDPQSECCGITTMIDPNFPKGKKRDKYPWTALIEYDKNGAIKTFCNGVLISRKYILTAAHCVSKPAINTAKPISIRLGEYITSIEGFDCVKNKKVGRICTDGAISIPIEKIIVHPQYRSTAVDNNHDIALIRISEMAPYTDYIRPICLPTKDITLTTDSIYFNKVGWGRTAKGQIKDNNVRLRVRVPFVNRDECQPSFSPYNVTLWKGQLCAGGKEVKDFCKGDGGMALVYKNMTVSEVVGIVSFGPTGCVNKIPTVYTNVFEYINWINMNIVDYDLLYLL